MIGEHGDNVVAIWSSVTMVGMPLHKALPGSFFDDDELEVIRLTVINNAYAVISLKGYTSWIIGYFVNNHTESILHDQMSVHPVSVLPWLIRIRQGKPKLS